MAREACDDDATSGTRGEDPPQCRTDRHLGFREPWLLRVGGVGQKKADAGAVCEGSDARKVGPPPVNGCQVELEVARMQDDSLGRMEGRCESVGDGVGDRDELDIERADLTALPVVHLDEPSAVDEPRFFDAVSREPQSES